MMRGLIALQIDFQQRRSAQPAIGWLLLVLGALLVAAACAEYSAVDADVVALRAKAAQQHAAKPAAKASPEEARVAEQAAKAADVVRDQLAVPWPSLFVQLEGASNDDIALLSLQADPSQRSMRLGGEARSFGALMEYVRRLEASEAFANVRLAGHEVRQQDPNRPVSFSLTAAWVKAP